jgi:hypothetical protein
LDHPSLSVRASGHQNLSRIGPGFDPSILRHSGIWGVADKAVLINVHIFKNEKIQKIFFKGLSHEMDLAFEVMHGQF